MKIRVASASPATEGTNMLGDARMKLGLMVVPAVLGLALLTSGCNTMRGVGEDVSAAGSGMSGAAEATEEKIEDETKTQ
jgi:predicted small secreted protein